MSSQWHPPLTVHHTISPATMQLSNMVDTDEVRVARLHMLDVEWERIHDSYVHANQAKYDGLKVMEEAIEAEIDALNQAHRDEIAARIAHWHAPYAWPI